MPFKFSNNECAETVYAYRYGIQKMNINEDFQTEGYLIIKHFPWSFTIYELTRYDVSFSEQYCSIDLITVIVQTTVRNNLNDLNE